MFLQNLLILLVGVSVATALVFSVDALYDTQYGYCKFHEPTVTDLTDLRLGEIVRAKNLCGVVKCVKERYSRTHIRITYCQRTVPFAECETDGINTETTYPDCCWQCVDYKKC